MSDIEITLGHVARHTPPGAGAQGRDTAISDIAQDLLLRHLDVTSILDPLAQPIVRPGSPGFAQL
jgi:hypothetical protein